MIENHVRKSNRSREYLTIVLILLGTAVLMISSVSHQTVKAQTNSQGCAALAVLVCSKAPPPWNLGCAAAAALICPNVPTPLPDINPPGGDSKDGGPSDHGANDETAGTSDNGGSGDGGSGDGGSGDGGSGDGGSGGCGDQSGEALIYHGPSIHYVVDATC